MSVINVKDFGAAGDGKTDDTAAIKAAISAAQDAPYKGEIYFPSGEYCFSEQLVFDGVKVAGAGMGSTTLKLVASVGPDVPAIQLAKGIVARRVSFRDIQVRSGIAIPSAALGTSPSESNGIQLNGSSHLENVLVRGFHKGVVVVTDHNYINNSTIIECYYGLYFHNDQGDNCVFHSVVTGHKLASVACWRMRDTLLVRTHVGYSPYGFYQVPFTNEWKPDFFMHDVHMSHTRFESCGNSAIYSANWNHGVDAGGLISCTFEHIGYTWSTAHKLASMPSDYVVQVGHCKGSIYYYPGASRFRTGKGQKNIWYVDINNASWYGDFQMEEFDIRSGYVSSLYPDRQQAVVTNGPNGGVLRTTVIKERGTAGNELKPWGSIYLKLYQFSGKAGVPVPIATPKNLKISGGQFPFAVTANTTDLDDSAVLIQGNTISIVLPDDRAYTGMIKLEGELQ